MTRTTHPHRFSSRLNAEWERLRRRPDSLAAARSWNLPLPAGHELRDLGEILDISHARHPDADRMLISLIHAARHHQLAGRIVVQRILPGLVLSANRYRNYYESADPVEIAAGMAWEVIHEYDITRRTHQIAATLVTDTLYRAFRAPLRRKNHGEVTWAPVRFIEATLTELHEPSSALEELAGVVRDADEAGVPPGDLDLVRQLAQVDSPVAVAERKGVTVRTIRNRRDRAVARIRDAVVAA